MMENKAESPPPQPQTPPETPLPATGERPNPRAPVSEAMLARMRRVRPELARNYHQRSGE
jgi:hypothetical protein